MGSASKTLFMEEEMSEGQSSAFCILQFLERVLESAKRTG